MKMKKKKSSKVTPEEENHGYMNTAEEEAVSSQVASEEDEAKKVSMKKMEKAVQLLQEEFNLSDKGFSVTSFTDKGSSVKLSMTNGDFDVSVIVNDAESHGLMTE